MKSEQLSRMISNISPALAPELVRMLKEAHNAIFHSLQSRGFWLDAAGNVTYIPDMETKALNTRLNYITRRCEEAAAKDPRGHSWHQHILRDPSYRWIYWTLRNRNGLSHSFWTTSGRVRLALYPEPHPLDATDIYIDPLVVFMPGEWDFEIEEIPE